MKAKKIKIMELTADQMQELDHIPTDEITQDIKDTEGEIKDYNDELEILMRNPPQNRLRIYMIEGHIIRHEELIKKLNRIINFRKGVRYERSK
jgi:hypothetical protein